MAGRGSHDSSSEVIIMLFSIGLNYYLSKNSKIINK